MGCVVLPVVGPGCTMRACVQRMRFMALIWIETCVSRYLKRNCACVAGMPRKQILLFIKMTTGCDEGMTRPPSELHFSRFAFAITSSRMRLYSTATFQLFFSATQPNGDKRFKSMSEVVLGIAFAVFLQLQKPDHIAQINVNRACVCVCAWQWKRLLTDSHNSHSIELFAGESRRLNNKTSYARRKPAFWIQILI